MQIKKILISGILCAFHLLSFGQNTASISGQVKDEAGQTIPGVSVRLQNINQVAITGEGGNYKFSGLAAGKYTIQINAVGFIKQTREVSLSNGQQLNLNIKLKASIGQLADVTVTGRSAVKEVNRQAFNVTAIDATKLYNTTLDVSGALDKVAGVRVRESGGVGSDFNLSLNGFSGNHVKYFIDGIPMDNFGSSFQINNIPINIAERIEVYKGVVPMWLGSDALGGAVNIVTGDRYRNFIDVSYSFGSFNTHRSVLNTAITTKKGFTVQLNAFQNYSDNNYKVTIDAADIYTGAFAPSAVLRRFHDTYHNESIIANVGLINKKFADKLLLGITLGRNYKEIQTGARMDAVFGGWHRRGSTIMPTLKYKKTNLIKGLDVTLNANYNIGYDQNIDTVNARFDWYGNRKPNGSSGERSRSLYKYRNNPVLITSMANYKLSEKHSIALSNVFTMFNRKGSDELNPTRPELEDVKKSNKNVLGVGYNYDVKDKWSATVFGRLINLHNTSGSPNNSRKNNLNKIGYGLASTYFITKNLQAKTSYELTNRMPNAEEIFGDAENLEGNPNLKPESSNNINLGFIYNFKLNDINRFSITANGVYRYATNFIFSRLNANQQKLIADNRDGVSTIGADGEIRYSFKNWLSAGTSITYQYLKSLQKYEFDNATGQYYTNVSPLYLNQMPNIPHLFANADLSVSLRDVGRKGNHLTLGSNLLFVDQFWLYWPSEGSRDASANKRGIPTQISTDLNAVYSLKNGRYNIAFEAKNITDARLVDNFSLQKPSRGFYLNLRYFLNK